MSRIVEYIIGLRDQFSAAAAKIGQSSKQAEQAVAAMGNAVNRAEQALARVRPPPALAGVPGQFERITTSANNATAAVTRQGGAVQSLALRTSAAAKQLGGGGGSDNILAAGIGSGVALHSVRKAVNEFREFERIWVRMERVFPGGREEFDAATKSLDRMATTIPLTRNEIYKLATEAIKSDVINEDTPNKIDELKRYVAVAAEFKEAFDLPIDKAATYLAKLKSSLGLTMAELRTLGDRMMWIEQKSAADPGEVLEVVRRNAALGMAIAGKQGVFDVAAIGGAQVAAGIKQEVAATGLRTLLVRLQQAAGLTLSEAETKHLEEAGFSEKEIAKGERGMATARMALTKLGLDPDEFTKRITTDLLGGVTDLVNRVGKLPKHEQGGVLGMLAGMRSLDALQGLVANPKLLEQAKALRDDPAGAGALARAYAKNLDLLDSHLKQLNNTLTIIKTALVDTWKPAMKAAADAVNGFSQVIQSNPILSKGVSIGAGLMAAAAGLGALRLGASFLRYAFAPLAALFAPIISGAIQAGAAFARIATWAYRFGGAAAVASLAARSLLALLARMTMVGAAFMIGYEVIQNWEKLRDIIAEVQAMLANKAPSEVGTKPAWMESMRQWFTGLGQAETTGIGPAFTIDGYREMLRRNGIGPGIGESQPSVPRMSWGAGLPQAQAERDINVRTTLDPIQIQAPPTIQVQVTGTVNGSVQGQGQIGLSATAPRGHTSATSVPGPGVSQ